MRLQTHQLDRFCKDRIELNLLNKQGVLTFESVLSHFSTINSEPNWISIKNWTKFEAGDKEYSIQEIIDIFEIENLSSSCEIYYLVTIESYAKNIIFELRNIDEFIHLVNNYSTIVKENIEFMQPMDYVFFDKDFNHFILIHHDGYKLVFYQP